MEKGLISVIIACYNNFKYLYDALDSVFIQDYEKIELIVADDCSNDFPFNIIKQYIESNKKQNIVNYLLKHEQHNVGTVKNLNNAIELAKGEFCFFMACDDTFNDPHSISNLIDGFKGSSDIQVVVGQTALYDEEMHNLYGYYLIPELKNTLLLKGSEKSKELLKELVTRGACIPTTSICVRKEISRFDESYLLIEDYPFHIKLALNNVSIKYVNKIIAKHRNGGVSHSNNKITGTKIKYYADTMKCINEYIFSNLDIIDDDLIKKRVYTSKMREMYIYKLYTCIYNKTLFSVRYLKPFSVIFFSKIKMPVFIVVLGIYLISIIMYILSSWQLLEINKLYIIVMYAASSFIILLEILFRVLYLDNRNKWIKL